MKLASPQNRGEADACVTDSPKAQRNAFTDQTRRVDLATTARATAKLNNTGAEIGEVGHTDRAVSTVPSNCPGNAQFGCLVRNHFDDNRLDKNLRASYVEFVHDQH